MIVARICGLGGRLLFHGSVEIEGSPAGDDYRQGGWFPVESFGFGFDPQKGTADGQAKSGTPAGKGAPAPRPAGNAPPTPKAPAEDKRPEVTISKDIDRATTDLMALAMKHHSHGKGAVRGKVEGDIELQADIHILGSFFFKDGHERTVYPSLMIHLQYVRVTKWSISGSGNGRPSESLTLEYDRSAMYYVYTDGETFEHYGPKGWDQKKNEEWPSGESLPNFYKFIPKPRVEGT